MTLKLIHQNTDSTGARGIANRLGAGRVRHIETRYLRVQQLLQKKQVGLKKVESKDNRADLGTKALPAAEFQKLLAMVNAGARWRATSVRALVASLLGHMI